MPDVFALLSRWWKGIFSFTLMATAFAAAVMLLLPKKFVSTATALPASSFNNDKASVFNTNIQELYSAFGTPDDLDKLIGTARLDTLYIALVDSLQLTAHYGLPQNKQGAAEAVQVLKRNTLVSKSEWGELKIRVRDGDRTQAAQLANGLLKKLQGLHQALQNQSNEVVFEKLKQSYQALLQRDTAGVLSVAPASNPAQTELLIGYNNLLSQYRLMLATNPPALLVVEPARPALYADTTYRLAIVLATFFVAFLFSVVGALYLNRKSALL